LRLRHPRRWRAPPTPRGGRRTGRCGGSCAVWAAGPATFALNDASADCWKPL